jgi:hypothetical protein
MKQKETQNLALYPYTHKYNQYISLMRSVYEMLGFKVFKFKFIGGKSLRERQVYPILPYLMRVR